MLLIAISIGTQEHLDAVGIPSHATRLAIDRLRCLVQGQVSPLRSKAMLSDPIVQVAQQHLEVKRKLVFLQMAFPAKGFGVNGIARSFALDELLV